MSLTSENMGLKKRSQQETKLYKILHGTTRRQNLTKSNNERKSYMGLKHRSQQGDKIAAHLFAHYHPLVVSMAVEEE